jgi:dUTPase
MKINIINKSQHALPNYETIASAGMDLRANLTESVTLAPLGRTVIKPVFYRITDRLRSKYDQEADWHSKWNNGAE